jgi:hypothetical protein
VIEKIPERKLGTAVAQVASGFRPMRNASRV